jgi:hypothetical protein
MIIFEENKIFNNHVEQDKKIKYYKNNSTPIIREYSIVEVKDIIKMSKSDTYIKTVPKNNSVCVEIEKKR